MRACVSGEGETGAAGYGGRMAVRRLVVVAAAVALLSLVLNNVATFSSSWVLQVLKDGHRRSVGLWRTCPQDDMRAHGPTTCKWLNWGSDTAGYQESHSTVKREFSDATFNVHDSECSEIFSGRLEYNLCL